MIIDPLELKRRYVQRIAGVRDDKVYIGPEIVTLEITNVCNLRCQYCITEHSPENPAHFEKARFFPWEKFLGLVADSVDLNVDQFTILGTGEPTKHPLFWDMMRHLEGLPMKVVIATNATFPSEHCLDMIKADHVVINLSAVDRQQYHALQGKDLFDHVVDNIKRLVSLRDSSKPGFYIELCYIVNTLNIDQKQKMQDLAAQLRVNSVHFEIMSVDQYNQKIALSRKSVSDLKGLEGLEDGKKGIPPASLNGWFNVLVLSNGDLSNCYEGPQEYSGDLDKWSLKEFWHSPYMMKIRNVGKKGLIRGVERRFRSLSVGSLYDH